MFLLLLQFFISFSDLLLSSLTLPSSSTSDLDIDPSAFQSCVVQLQANLKKKREREVSVIQALSLISFKRPTTVTKGTRGSNQAQAPL